MLGVDRPPHVISDQLTRHSDIERAARHSDISILCVGGVPFCEDGTNTTCDSLKLGVGHHSGALLYDRS